MVSGRLLAGTAIAAVTILAATQGASALPYANAINNITDISITGTGLVSILPLVTARSQHGTTDASFDSYPPGAHNATGIIDNVTDALEATSGVAGHFPTQNIFTPQAGALLGMIGSRADSYISGGVPGTVSASNVAESRGNAVGNAVGSNTASVNFGAISLTKPGEITISFSDAIYLEAATQFTGESANGTIHNDFLLTNAATGAVVFEFAPNGTGGVIGGTVTSDPFNLQAQANSTDGSPLDQIIKNSGFFSATSFTLPVGAYNIGIVSSASTTIQAPEPASFAILGAGLLGLGIAVRRRRG